MMRVKGCDSVIAIDRKVARAALKLSKRSYSANLLYDPAQKTLFLVSDPKEVLDSALVSLTPEEVSSSIARLMQKGYFVKKAGYWGGFTFGIMPELRHRFAFWLDAFTKKFWGGFFTGVITAVTANLLSGYVQTAAAELFQWLRSLL